MKELIERFSKSKWIVIFLAGMAVVYGYSMFHNKPWYDELYTYYYFISRGPVYAAIHWPVPNNHMGYSVLSAIVDLFGNNYLGLRGVSFISSLLNVYLVYILAKKLCTTRFFAVLGCFIGAYLTYSLSFQGRGYALTTACMLVALNILACLAFKEDRVMYYLVWICALVLGLYTIPSSAYWVLPVCLTGGVHLLLTKQYKKLGKLIVSSVIAAVITFGLYTIVWLAIGSNLLSKDPESAYLGIYQLDIIKTAPIDAWKTGMQYMLDTPYIQSIDRHDCITGLWGYFVSLFDQYYSYLGRYAGTIFNVIYIIATVFALSELIGYFLRRRRKEAQESTQDDLQMIKENPHELLCTVVVAVFGLSIPVMLIIQSVNPYLRVFSFFASVAGLMVCYLLGCICKIYRNVFKQRENLADIVECTVGIVIFCIACVSVCCFSFGIGKRFQIQLADRENDIYYALEAADDEIRDIDTIFYTDDFQKYVLKFYYDIQPDEVSMSEADYIMVSNSLLEGTEQADWPMLVTTDSFDREYFDANFEPVSTTDDNLSDQTGRRYFLYKRR